VGLRETDLSPAPIAVDSTVVSTGVFGLVDAAEKLAVNWPF
jgi:hypothetical protein